MEYNFVEVVKQFDRMCKRYNNHCSPEECPICALISQWESCHDSIWGNGCLDFAKKWPERFVEEVMNWTEENEKPIYPTTRNIISKIRMLMQIDESKVGYEEFLDMPLNDIAADYFGIEPINKDKLV